MQRQPGATAAPQATSDDSMVRIPVRLPRTLVDWMDSAAADLGVSRSAFVRILAGNARRQAQLRNGP